MAYPLRASKPNTLVRLPCSTILSAELTGSMGGLLLCVEVAADPTGLFAVGAAVENLGPESDGISSNSSDAS